MSLTPEQAQARAKAMSSQLRAALEKKQIPIMLDKRAAAWLVELLERLAELAGNETW